jgi:hypothetical protein
LKSVIFQPETFLSLLAAESGQRGRKTGRNLIAAARKRRKPL